MRKKRIGGKKLVTTKKKDTTELGLSDEGELGDEQTIKVVIHYGGTIKQEDGVYQYLSEVSIKTVFWKFEEFEWAKFTDVSCSEGVEKEVKLIWFKRIGDMKRLDYVFDRLNSDMPDLSCLANSDGEIEVYLEQADDAGYDPDDEMMAEEEYESNENVDMEYDWPPLEDEDPEDFEDETPAAELDRNVVKDTCDGEKNNLKVYHNASEIDDGEEVIVDAGNGGDDDRFVNVFQEGIERDPVVEEMVNELMQMQEEEAKEAASEESDPDFGLDDVMYPDTPLESKEEWEQWKNPKKKKRNMKFNGDPDQEPYLWLFQTFNSGLEFKYQLLKYSLNTCFDINMAKSEANRIAAVCENQKCSWRVYCSIERPLNKWMVKVCHYQHNHASSSKVSMLKQGVIASLFMELIRRNLSLPTADIKDIIKERYDIVVSLSKCFKARCIALDSILEAQKIQFGKLWDYDAELLRSNKGITTEILTVDNNGKQQFRGFYLCFKELRECWHKWCRPVIGLDGCFLKWDLEGNFLAAVGRDTYNKMYLIAWAVMTCENEDTWGWFIQKLKVDLELGVGKNLTIISDKHKGLIHAMGVELPQAEHRMCARHIYANWKKSFSKAEYKNLSWGVAYIYHEGKNKEKMKIVDTYDPASYQALLRTDPHRWCRAFFDP